MSLELILPLAPPTQGLLPTATDVDVIVIGGGPAGATAALYASRANLVTLVLDKGITAGALGQTPRIANYPGVLEEISGAELVALIRRQAESFGATFVQDRVQAVDLVGNRKAVYTNHGTFFAPVVIITTGSMVRGRRVEGEDRLQGRGVSYCATCDGALFQNQDVAVIGNDEEALDAALFLTRFARHIHLVSRTMELRAAAGPTAVLAEHPKIELTRGPSLRGIRGEAHVESILISPRGGPTRTLPVTDFLDGQVGNRPGECLQVDREFRTNLTGVFAVGDLLCDHVKQAVVAAAEGAVAAMAAEKQLHGRRRLSFDWAK